LSAITSGTHLLMGGLPFSGYEYSDFTIGYKSGGWTSSDAIVGGYTQAGQSYLYFVKPDGGEARQDVGSVALTKLMLNITYMTT